jgi:hypothetical protein
VPYSVAGWIAFFAQHGIQLPPGQLSFAECGWIER